MIENDYHLFFQCTLSRQVWLTANPPINTANFPPESDGVQSTLTLIITDTTPEPLLCKILYTLWFIWKARNDYHFNSKDWTPPQVHHAIQAYMVQNEQNPPQTSPQFAQTPGNHLSVLQTHLQQPTMHFCPYPANLQSSRCYVDAAVVPNDQNIITNIVGLGIFILNFQVQPLQAIYVKAQLQHCHSVLMSEAAALALGASIVQALQIPSCNFLSESQQVENQTVYSGLLQHCSHSSNSALQDQQKSKYNS